MRAATLRSWILLGMMTVAGAIPAACGGETSTSYGPPDGLVGRAAPQVTASATATGTATSTATGTATGTTPPAGDSGMPAPAGDSGTTTGTDSGTSTMGCSVSWATDVFPMLESTGSGACGSGACHANGAQQPTVLDGNAAGTYNTFKNYTLINAVGYITPGNTNPANSSIDCDLVTGLCGANPMPLAPTGSLSQTQKTTIDTWVKCGAPEN